MVDGHGLSHPRSFGIASHLGVLLDIPTIGVAKSILVGDPESSLGETIGSTTSLEWKGKEIGLLMRPKNNCKPIVISVGHKVTLRFSYELVCRSITKYRLPEPTRQAHLAANRCRKNRVSN